MLEPENPLISIIIPTYNRYHLLGATLDSIRGQTYSNWECLVVDDGSSDYTAELLEFYIKSDIRFKFLTRPKMLKKGANSCRNFGFTQSKGEFINWFDSDDVMMETFIEKKHQNFISDSKFVISNGYYTNKDLKLIGLMTLKKDFSGYRDILLWSNHVTTNSIMFKRSFLIEKKLFNEALYRGQEAELFLRLFFKLPKESFGIITEPLFYYRQHSSTVTAKNKSYIDEFKDSESFIYIENFKRSIELKDLELINFVYQKVINLFFLALENNNKNNAKYILKNLIQIFRLLDKKFSIELFLIGEIFLLFNRGSYRIERRWKRKMFNTINT